MPEFTGFPVEALDFYDDLEMDNTKSFWATHRSVYDTAVLGPMTSLMRGLEPTFGPAKVFRPYRDVRFAKDKTPYKDHQGAFVAAGPSTGWYVEGPGRSSRRGILRRSERSTRFAPRGDRSGESGQRSRPDPGRAQGQGLDPKRGDAQDEPSRVCR